MRIEFLIVILNRLLSSELKRTSHQIILQYVKPISNRIITNSSHYHTTMTIHILQIQQQMFKIDRIIRC